mmetsp:Transcript_2219/g.4553  ORF Transcript_2219/g.4553 Transcript_2219/m.4553 type:complete len:216 (-) Transcript_2219:738-1385(-)
MPVLDHSFGSHPIFPPFCPRRIRDCVERFDLRGEPCPRQGVKRVSVDDGIASDLDPCNVTSTHILAPDAFSSNEGDFNFVLIANACPHSLLVRPCKVTVLASLIRQPEILPKIFEGIGDTSVLLDSLMPHLGVPHTSVAVLVYVQLGIIVIVIFVAALPVGVITRAREHQEAHSPCTFSFSRANNLYPVASLGSNLWISRDDAVPVGFSITKPLG